MLHIDNMGDFMEILLRDEVKQTLFENSRGLTICEGKSPCCMLAADCNGIFDVVSADAVCVAYVSESGEIILLEKLGRGWKKTVLLKSRSGMMDIFGLRLVSGGDDISLIYGLKHNFENMIVHQFLPSGAPHVVASSHGERFFVRRDGEGCVYVITEPDENTWQMSFLRHGVWSSPEELISGCEIEDVMTDGYNSFCLLFKNEEGRFLRYRDTCFGVRGEKPYLVKSGNEFMAVSEIGGRIYCTDGMGEKMQITSETVRDYILRLPYGGEYAVCEGCRGNFIHGVPRLFVIDRARPPRAYGDDSVRLELTKRIIELEARIALLEKEFRTYNPPKEQKALPENS